VSYEARRSMAHARLRARVRNPPQGKDYERMVQFLAALRERGSMTLLEMHALTDLGPRSTPITTALIARLVEEGLVERVRIGGHVTYKLAESSSDESP
jgi:hypothetical protein